MIALADGTGPEPRRRPTYVRRFSPRATARPEARPFLDLFLKLLADQETNTVVALVVAVVGVLQLGATLVSLGKSPDQMRIEKQITEIHKTTSNVFVAEDGSPQSVKLQTFSRHSAHRASAPRSIRP